MAFLNVWNSSGKLRVGLSIIFLLTATALLKDVLIDIFVGRDVDPLAQGKFQVFLDPSSDHLLGTDRYGRDVLALVLVGLPNTLLASAIAGGARHPRRRRRRLRRRLQGRVDRRGPPHHHRHVPRHPRPTPHLHPHEILLQPLYPHSRLHPCHLRLALRRPRHPLPGPLPARAPLRRAVQSHQPVRPADHLRRHPAQHAALHWHEPRALRIRRSLRLSRPHSRRSRSQRHDRAWLDPLLRSNLGRAQPRQVGHPDRADDPPCPLLPRRRPHQPGPGRGLQSAPPWRVA